MNKKEKIVVYVFGIDGEMYNRYDSNLPVDWVKIGLTRTYSINDDAMQAALLRCKGESKTGLPYPCCIYDVFEFPNYTNEKIDDTIRKILCSFGIKISLYTNKELEDEIIPSGNEFVYNVTKKQIEIAINSLYGRLYSILTSEQILQLQSLITSANNVDNTDETNDIVENNVVLSKYGARSYFNVDFWKQVYSKLNDTSRQYCNVTDNSYNRYKCFSSIQYKMFKKLQVVASFGVKSKRVKLVIEGDANISNADFYESINNMCFYNNNYSIIEHIKKTGETVKYISLFDKQFSESPVELINELANAINDFINYIVKTNDNII